MNQAAVLRVEEFVATVSFSLRHQRRYLKDTTLRVHHGRAGRSGKVLKSERDHVRVVQGTADALDVGGDQVTRYE